MKKVNAVRTRPGGGNALWKFKGGKMHATLNDGTTVVLKATRGKLKESAAARLRRMGGLSST